MKHKLEAVSVPGRENWEVDGVWDLKMRPNVFFLFIYFFGDISQL